MNEVEKLRAENAALRARIKALRRIIEDMSGPALVLDDDPYEDEHPLVHGWGEDK